jgi:beta-1,4-N-acetylglucosaminyltransferase
MGGAPEAFPRGGLRRAAGMILVLVGTSPDSFERLVRAVDDYAQGYKEEIFIQLGHTVYIPKNARYKRFLEKQEILQKIREADLVITQGGFGSIADCLKEGKRIVAVPRKPEFREAHHEQDELVRELEKLGRLIGVYEISALPMAIQRAKKLAIKTGTPNIISQIINAFLAKNSNDEPNSP